MTRYFRMVFRRPALASAGALDDPAKGAVPQPEDRYSERRVKFPLGVTSFADVAYSPPPSRRRSRPPFMRRSTRTP
jgi:hypothetical protein